MGRVRYYDHDRGEYVYGEVEDSNGSLRYVRDERTGEADWRGREELDRED